LAEPLAELTDGILEALRGKPPHIVAIGGAVAVGKSTVAADLAQRMASAGRRVDIVATDSFLFPNAVLSERGSTLRKGFPETYDFDSMVRFILEVREGADSVEVPVYSHRIYDIVVDDRTVLERPDVVVLEGVVALQPDVVEHVDVPIYIDAAEADVRSWFIARFLSLTHSARKDPSSFYRMFVGMTPADVRAVAEGTWDSINGVNLHEHIVETRSKAMFVIEKAGDHSIRAIVRA
jgi:type I pantothenate kinase